MTFKKEGRRYWSMIGAVFVVAFGLYALGVKFVLPLVALATSFWYLPVPRQLESVIGRACGAFVFTIVLLQVAALTQFVVWPSSSFVYVAALYAVFTFVMALGYGRAPKAKIPWVTRYDIAGLIIATLFVLPFAAILSGHGTVQRIVEIAGLQSPDAGHHFEFINSMVGAQHLDTSGYPKSFHLAYGFVQSAFVGTQDGMSWSANVITFFAQYILFGGLLAMSLGYLCMMWLERMLKKAPSKKVSVLAAIAVALPLQLVIMWPFVEHGFLNYMYLVTVLALAVVWVDDALQAKQKNDAWLIYVLLFALAASLTWPLVVPAVLFAILIMMWPLRLQAVWAMVRQHKVAAVLVALQLAPLAVQLTQHGTTSLNDQGDLRTLAVFVVLGGLVAVMCLARFLPQMSQRVVVGSLTPFVFLAGGILLLQLFLFGEPRYFAIKVTLLLEVFLLVFAVSGLFAWAIQRKVKVGGLLLLSVAPLSTVLLLLTATSKPLEDVRNLFRDQSGQAKPAFYDHDVYEYAKLGKEGKIDYFNSTVLHYNAENGTLYSHPFLPQIAQYMKYPQTPGGLQAYACHRLIFRNIAYGDFSQSAQQQLISQIRICAADARANGQKYYIITDDASLQQVKSAVGEGRGVVYVSS